MKKYIGGPVQINTVMLSLKKETKTSSKPVHPDAMEVIVHFQPNPIA